MGGWVGGWVGGCRRGWIGTWVGGWVHGCMCTWVHGESLLHSTVEWLYDCDLPSGKHLQILSVCWL